MPFRLGSRSAEPATASAGPLQPTLERRDRAANASGFGPDPDRWGADGPAGVALDEVAALLDKRTLLLPLNPAQARTVAGYMKPLLLPAGHVLAVQAQPNDHPDMLLIVRGRVIQHTLVHGKALVCDVDLGSLGPGDFLCEPALLDGVARNVSCETTTPVVAAALSRGALDTLGHDHPDLAARLLSAVCQGLATRLRANHRRMTDASAAVRDMQDRLLHVSHLPRPGSSPSEADHA